MSTTTIPRRHSLHIPTRPPPIPIPPSLRESPYLNASLFKHLPSDEDERWLQDTVPLTQNAKGTVDRRGSIVRRSWPSACPSSADKSDSRQIPSPPLSPPIVHCRATSATRPDRQVPRLAQNPTDIPTH